MRGHAHYQFSLVVFPDDGCIICAGNEALGRALDNMTVHGISQHAQSHNCAVLKPWYDGVTQNSSANNRFTVGGRFFVAQKIRPRNGCNRPGSWTN